MEIRSLGESKGNYTNSSVRQSKQKEPRTHSMDNSNSGNGKLAVGLLAGASVGVLAGMLLAPERGRDMRRQISNSASKVGGQMTKTMDTYVSACRDTMNSWSSKRMQQTPASNEELNGPATFAVGSDSGSIDKHIL